MILSPGEYHKRVPKDPVENVKYRVDLLRHSKTSREFQRGLVEMCRRDLLFYVNTFLWQFNPRKTDVQVGPFITWGYQDEGFREMLRCIRCDCGESPEIHQHDLCIEKSREMGASWMLLIVFEWLWHFHPWQKFLLISRNEKAVEDEDPDSLFWKIDFMHRHQPDWLKPRIKRRKLFYGNEDNGSTITGQASTGKAGVGGRATAMGIDEFSQIDDDYEVLHRTSDTTGCRIFNFTHKGLDTAAYELTQRVDMRKLRLHWSSHPDKVHGLYKYVTEPNPHVEVYDKRYVFREDFAFVMDGKLRSPWYDEQCRRKGDPRAIAMDLDIDPAGSVSQFFDMGKISQLVAAYCCAPYWRGDLTFNAETARPLEFVQSPNGPLKLWLNPTGNGRPPAARYGMGADLAAGLGATPSCLSIVNGETGEKVAEYTNAHIEPTPLAPLAIALCRWFSTLDGEGAAFAWECPGPGLVFGRRVIDLGYRNVYYRTPYDKIARKHSDNWGWYPQAGPKRLLLEEYRNALETRQFLNRSKEAMDECRFFKWDQRGEIVHGGEDSPNNPGAARVNHADHTIADALAWMVSKDFFRGGDTARKEGVVVGSLAWRRLIAENERVKEEAWV